MATMAARPEARTNWLSVANTCVGGAHVEIAGRLVGQEDARRVGDRPGNGDALLLAAGKLRRPVHQPLLEPEIGQQLHGARPRSRRARPRIICGSITFSRAENSGSRW